MKNRHLLIVGIMAIVLMISGCGKKEVATQPPVQTEVQVTVAPSENSIASEETIDLVEMEEIPEDEQIKNIIGTKTEGSLKLIIVNNTGADIAGIYIRPNRDDEEWGEELINNSFVLKYKDKAIYYYPSDIKDDNGNLATSFDIRITYTDELKSECFFRKLPLKNITQITLQMDDSDDYTIPYATYLTGTSKVEVSTLNEVKKRLGFIGYDNSDQESNNETVNDNQVLPQVTPTQTPDNNNDNYTNPDNNGDVDIDYGHVDAGAEQAQEYIGRPLSDLINACGSPTGQTYEDEPETGKTGYHYYNTFTVSTTVDENGNETVAGVW